MHAGADCIDLILELGVVDRELSAGKMGWNDVVELNLSTSDFTFIIAPG